MRDARRQQLLKQILLELREQTDWLIEQTAAASPPPPVVVDQGFDAEARQNLRQIAETAAAINTVLRPGRAIWQQMMPLRRTVAKMRGRI